MEEMVEAAEEAIIRLRAMADDLEAWLASPLALESPSRLG